LRDLQHGEGTWVRAQGPVYLAGEKPDDAPEAQDPATRPEISFLFLGDAEETTLKGEIHV